MKQLLKTVLVLTLIGLAVPLFWAATHSAIKATSNHEFCGSCHSMEPMVQSFLMDTHGGNNAGGIQAECTDCHLPHTGPLRYLKQKTINGLWDVWVEHIVGAENIDWQTKREHRESFTYISGCLGCHNNLDKAAGGRHEAWVAHGPMLRGEKDNNCLSCHQHAGHRNLTEALNAARTTP